MSHWTVDGGFNRLASRKTHPRMSRAVPSGRREGMFPGRYSEIFGSANDQDVF